jgi:hypothetical protein
MDSPQSKLVEDRITNLIHHYRKERVEIHAYTPVDTKEYHDLKNSASYSWTAAFSNGSPTVLGVHIRRPADFGELPFELVD